MGLFSAIFGERKQITHVAVFTTDVGAAKTARSHGSIVQRVPPRTMFQTADSQLGLNGALVTYMADKPLEIEDAPEMSDADWKQFLDARFPGKHWNRWFGKTPNTIYSVVVVTG